MPLAPMSDRLVSAWISGTASRLCPLSGLRGDPADAAAMLREAAQGRADLLAQFAGMQLGLAAEEIVPQLVAQQMAHANLAVLAGADPEEAVRWIATGVKRGEDRHAGYRRS